MRLGDAISQALRHYCAISGPGFLPNPSSFLFCATLLGFTYLPMSSCGMAIDFGVAGQVPVPFDHFATVASRSSRQSAEAQDPRQACETATGSHDPVFVIALLNARRCLGQLRGGRVLRRP